MLAHISVLSLGKKEELLDGCGHAYVYNCRVIDDNGFVVKTLILYYIPIEN